MKIYNKLVRDRIPEIIRSQGEIPTIRILDEAEYSEHLERKLDEEVAEFHKERNLEELADILEVIFALSADLGYSGEALQDVYQRKHAERGGFEDRLLLISKDG